MLHRNRSPIRSVALASLTALAGMLVTAIGAIAQDKPPGAKPAGEPQVTELLVSPRPAPVPALRYRLLPLESERTPGDAAPIYLSAIESSFAAGLSNEDLRDIKRALLKVRSRLDAPRPPRSRH